MDLRFLAGGVAMIGVGVTLSLIYSQVIFSGPLEQLNPSRGIIQIGTIIASVGVLLTLISFGLRRKKRRFGGSGSTGAATFRPESPDAK